MITLRAPVVAIFCFIIAVGTRCSCCKCDEVKVKLVYHFNGL